MQVLVLIVVSILFFIPQAIAQAPGAPAHTPSFGELLFQMLPMLAIVYFIFYFIVVKPQQDKVKTQGQLLKSLKRGDSVTTSSGIIGKVSAVEEGVVALEVSPNVKIRFESSHIVKKEESKSAGVEKKAAS